MKKLKECINAIIGLMKIEKQRREWRTEERRDSETNFIPALYHKAEITCGKRILNTSQKRIYWWAPELKE